MTLEEAEDRFDGCPRVRQWVAVHGVNREGDLSVEEIVEITAAHGDPDWCRVVAQSFLDLSDRQRARLNKVAGRTVVSYAEGPGQAYLRTHPLTTAKDLHVPSDSH